MRRVQTAWLCVLAGGLLAVSACDKAAPPPSQTNTAPPPGADEQKRADAGSPSTEPDTAAVVADAGPPPPQRVRQAIAEAAEYAEDYPDNFKEAARQAQLNLLVAAAHGFYDTPHEPPSEKLADQEPAHVGTAVTLDDGRIQLEIEIRGETIRFEPFRPHFTERCEIVPTVDRGKPLGPARSIKRWKNPVKWFRFDREKGPALWLFFGKDDLTLWQHDEKQDCAVSVTASGLLTGAKDAGHELDDDFPSSHPMGAGDLAIPGAYGLELGEAKNTFRWEPDDDPVDERLEIEPLRGKKRVRLGHEAIGLYDRRGRALFTHEPMLEWEDGKMPCGDANLSLFEVGDTRYVRLHGTYAEQRCDGEHEIWARFDALGRVTEDGVEKLYDWAAGSGGWTYEGTGAEEVELRLPAGNGHLLYRHHERGYSSDGEVINATEFVTREKMRTRWAFVLDDRTIELADLRYDIDVTELVPFGALED